MARKKLSEYKAKTLLYDVIEEKYHGIHVSSDVKTLSKIVKEKTYVVKVDEGIKKRFKKGLVFLDQPANALQKAMKELRNLGYSSFLIEPYIPHDRKSERYLAIERIRDGYLVFCSDKGGIDIEEQEDYVKKFNVTSKTDWKQIAKVLSLSIEILQKIQEAFDTYYFSFLEINPLVIDREIVYFLDIAAEVDDTAEFFVDGAWDKKDFTFGERNKKTPQEEAIDQLSSKSQAALKLDVLAKDGSIFMLLSGGGASILLADEVTNRGFGKELANYGEYSGNPNAEEMYLYTKNLLELLITSTAAKKVLIIAGGVANFTDVRITFSGIIKALDEVKGALKKHGVKVFVRRGGPYQKEGLAGMKAFLSKNDLLGSVTGPEILLTQVVDQAIKYLK